MKMKHFVKLNGLSTIWYVGMCLIGFGLSDAATPSSNLTSSSGPWGLKPDPSVGLVVANCGNCHSPYLITHHYRDRESWDKTITKMESNGMTPPTKVVRKMLLDYLEKQQGTTEDNRPESSPWAHVPFDANPLWE